MMGGMSMAGLSSSSSSQPNSFTGVSLPLFLSPRPHNLYPYNRQTPFLDFSVYVYLVAAEQYGRWEHQWRKDQCDHVRPDQESCESIKVTMILIKVTIALKL